MAEAAVANGHSKPPNGGCEQARERGEVPVAREARSPGIYIAALVGLLLLGGPIARRIGEIMLPMLDQPDMLAGPYADPAGATAGHAVAMAVALAILPFFALAVAGCLLPYLLQNSIAISPQRIAPKLCHLSPASGFKRIFGARSLFEFAKSLAKMVAVAVGLLTSWPADVRPLGRFRVRRYRADAGHAAAVAAVTILLAATLVAVVIAARRHAVPAMGAIAAACA